MNKYSWEEVEKVAQKTYQKSKQNNPFITPSELEQFSRGTNFRSYEFLAQSPLKFTVIRATALQYGRPMPEA